MSIPLTVNGTIFNYPVNFDTNWGTDATNWAQAITVGTLQKAGGTFTLTANVDFGASFGVKSVYFETRNTNPATSGTVRLSSADPGVVFRNNANSGNLILTTDASDNLLYNGNIISSSGSAITPVSRGGTGDSSLTAYAVLAGGTTPTNPVQSVASVGLAGQVLTSNGAGALPSFQNTTGTGTVNSGTQYQLAYYATTGSTLSGNPNTMAASQAVVNDVNGVPTTTGNGGTTATEIGYVHGVTSSIQAQLNTLNSEIGANAGIWGPIGSSFLYSSATPPNANYMLKDGSAISRTTYAALFALIGTTFGPGDGSTTFNIPNAIDRMPVTAGNVYTLGQTGGSTTVSITDPGHNHTQNAHTHGDSGHNHITYIGNSGGTTLYIAHPAPNGTRNFTSTFSSVGTVGNASQTLPGWLTSTESAAITNTTATNNSSGTGITATATPPFLAEYWMYRII